MSLAAAAVSVLHWLALACLALFGIHRVVMLAIFARVRRTAPAPCPAFRDDDLPVVTVQLPIYNELHVAARLLSAVAALDYPRDRLEIQVLDDSSDETTHLVAALVRRHRAAGVDMTHVRRHGRDARRGYKAGALAAGLARARGSLAAVLDADFVPPPDFLRRTVPPFADPEVGAVQARWGYTNRGASLLTRVQALLLDGHFLIEHTARFRSGRFFNFNGTAGLWRVAAIRSAGGWQHDTLTEDLDLSYRAQLAGWRLVYLAGAVCPGELPDETSAFESQQFRWAKGSVQTARKLLPRIWRAPIPLGHKVESTFHLLANAVYLVIAVPVFLALPLALTVRPAALSRDATLYGAFFLIASLTVAAYYAVAARLAEIGVRRGLVLVPALMALGVGMVVNNGRAVLEALAGRPSGFVRTPKYSEGSERVPRAGRRYRPERSRSAGVELALAAYLAASAAIALARGVYGEIPALVLFAAGFAWVGGTALREARRTPATPSVAPSTASPALCAAAVRS